MNTYKITASQLVHFTVLINAENEAAANEIAAAIYPDDCYEHDEIDWQIDSISEADALDLNYFPTLERVTK
jgi:hypothetical protein